MYATIKEVQMPIYEYKCKLCGSVNEFLIGVGEDEKLVCKKCGCTDLEKLISVSHVSPGGLIDRQKGLTCCGKEERCETPPCSQGTCRR